MIQTEYAPGDWVIYRKSKVSPHPGERAHAVHPSPKGEHYSYVVDKYWVVEDVTEDGKLRLRTRRGKEHVVRSDDPNLRHAGFLDRWLNRDRYTSIAIAEA